MRCRSNTHLDRMRRDFLGDIYIIVFQNTRLYARERGSEDDQKRKKIKMIRTDRIEHQYRATYLEKNITLRPELAPYFVHQKTLGLYRACACGVESSERKRREGEGEGVSKRIKGSVRRKREWKRKIYRYIEKKKIYGYIDICTNVERERE